MQPHSASRRRTGFMGPALSTDRPQAIYGSMPLDLEARPSQATRDFRNIWPDSAFTLQTSSACQLRSPTAQFRRSNASLTPLATSTMATAWQPCQRPSLRLVTSNTDTSAQHKPRRWRDKWHKRRILESFTDLWTKLFIKRHTEEYEHLEYIRSPVHWSEY